MFIAPFLIGALLILPSCSSSNCKDVENTLRQLESEYVQASDAAKLKPETSETWIPVINKGLDYVNYALNNPSCISPEGKAQWQTMKENLSLRLQSWIK